MKTAILVALMSFSAVASECYVRTVEIESTEVTMAKEICIEGIEVKAVVTGKNTAVINYTLDGVSKSLTQNLTYPVDRRDGTVMFFLNSLESNYTGGYCGDMTLATIEAVLVMNRDGSNARLEDLKGSVGFTNDNCHSDTREIQAVPFVKVTE